MTESRGIGVKTEYGVDTTAGHFLPSVRPFQTERTKDGKTTSSDHVYILGRDINSACVSSRLRNCESRYGSWSPFTFGRLFRKKETGESTCGPQSFPDSRSGISLPSVLLCRKMTEKEEGTK